MSLNDIFRMFISPELQKALLPLKITFILLSLFFSILIIYSLFVTPYLKYRFFEEWEDYLHWKRFYSLKARKRRARRPSPPASPTSTSTSAPASASVPVSVPASGSTPASSLGEYFSPAKQGEEIDLKNGRVERNDWERILDKLESGKEINYKLALIDADKFFNQVLKEKGKELSKETISNAEDVLKAKEVLKKMLSHPKAILSLERAKELIGIYQKALSEMS